MVAPAEDNASIRVRYLDAPSNPSLVGTEDLVTADRVAGFTPTPPGPEWDEKVSVFLHHVPESEEGEGGYEATTMGGAPYGIIVATGEMETAQEALARLLAALRTFGYSGAVTVEDSTYVGGVQSYETQA